jgi:hypothetical protein
MSLTGSSELTQGDDDDDWDVPGPYFMPLPWWIIHHCGCGGLTWTISGYTLTISGFSGFAPGTYTLTATMDDGIGDLYAVDFKVTVTSGASKPGTATVTINNNFPLLFQRSLYDVVRYDPNTSDHIPGPETGSPGGINLEQFFSAKTAGVPGWICSNSTAKTDIQDYGFLPTWKLSTCGAVS